MPDLEYALPSALADGHEDVSFLNDIEFLLFNHRQTYN